MAAVRFAPQLTALREKPRRLLAVLAHPDDEAYGCAGAFARAAADPDAATVLLCLTRGEASSLGPQRGLSADEVGDLREARLEEVARILDLDGLIIATLPDGRVARLPLEEAAAPIRAVLESFDPQVVITGDARGVNAHPDHIAAHWAVRHALVGAPKVRLAMLAYTQETREASLPRLLFATAEEEIDATLKLTASEVDAKEACLRVHEALVTLREDGPPELMRRPALEHYDFLGEPQPERLADLFHGL